jgi:hypothetical protein
MSKSVQSLISEILISCLVTISNQPFLFERQGSDIFFIESSKPSGLTSLPVHVYCKLLSFETPEAVSIFGSKHCIVTCQSKIAIAHVRKFVASLNCKKKSSHMYRSFPALKSAKVAAQHPFYSHATSAKCKFLIGIHVGDDIKLIYPWFGNLFGSDCLGQHFPAFLTCQ